MADPQETQTPASPEQVQAEPQSGMIEIRNSFNQLGQIKKQFTPEQMEFVMKTIAPSLNKEETWLFLLKCQLSGFNPLNGEIYAYTVVKDGRRQLVMIAARDGKRIKAERSGRLEYIKTKPIYVKAQTVEIKDKDGKVKSTETITVTVPPWDGKLWGAECRVKRLDRTEETLVQVPLSEYTTGKSTWVTKPETMIKKVAQSQALSEAFPDLSGIYDESESFGGDSKGQEMVIEQPDEPATPEMMQSLKAVGADMKRTYSRKEAMDEITRLTAGKATKKGSGK